MTQTRFYTADSLKALEDSHRELLAALIEADNALIDIRAYDGRPGLFEVVFRAIAKGLEVLP